MLESPSWGVLRRFPVNVICSILVAAASYQFIEKPVLNLKSKYHVEIPNIVPEVMNGIVALHHLVKLDGSGLRAYRGLEAVHIIAKHRI